MKQLASVQKTPKPGARVADQAAAAGAKGAVLVPPAYGLTVVDHQLLDGVAPRTPHAHLRDVIQCGRDKKAQSVPDVTAADIMPLFQKNGIDIQPEAIRIVKDDRSGQICHDYALRGIGVTVLHRFTLALKADEIAYAQRNDYHTVIAAYSDDGSALLHTARWEKGQNDEFVHKLSGFPYFACDPFTYQAASKAKHVWFFGHPPKSGIAPPMVAGVGAKTRSLPARAGGSHVHGAAQPPSWPVEGGGVNTEQAATSLAIQQLGTRAQIVSEANLRADDASKTVLAQLSRDAIVIVTSPQKTGSRFALGAFSIAQDHYWVTTTDGYTGWVRKNAVKLSR